MITQRGDERLLDNSHLVAIRIVDGHGFLERKPALLDLAKLTATHIFKNECLSQAQRLAVHFEDPLTFLVFDPEIISDRDHLLTDFVSGWHENSLSYRSKTFTISITY